MTLSLPLGFGIAELSNIAVANPICEGNATSWITSYRTGQDFHVKVDIPGPSPNDATYGLSQTLLMAIRIGMYSSDEDNQKIELWRTPTQQSTKFDFKGRWLDTSESANGSSSEESPYYSDEAVAKAEMGQEGIEAKQKPIDDRRTVTLRMRKTPQITLPTQIRRKNKPDEKMYIIQLDVQERYLISLFRDEDLKKNKDKDGDTEASHPKPLLQWIWEHKSAWFRGADGNPQFEPRPGFARSCALVEDRLIDKFQLEGPSVTAGGTSDHFRELPETFRGGPIGEASDWEAEMTDEWEACDA